MLLRVFNVRIFESLEVANFESCPVPYYEPLARSKRRTTVPSRRSTRHGAVFQLHHRSGTPSTSRLASFARL